jgi:hypothetical protein
MLAGTDMGSLFRTAALMNHRPPCTPSHQTATYPVFFLMEIRSCFWPELDSIRNQLVHGDFCHCRARVRGTAVNLHGIAARHQPGGEYDARYSFAIERVQAVAANQFQLNLLTSRLAQRFRLDLFERRGFRGGTASWLRLPFARRTWQHPNRSCKCLAGLGPRPGRSPAGGPRRAPDDTAHEQGAAARGVHQATQRRDDGFASSSANPLDMPPHYNARETAGDNGQPE